MDLHRARLSLARRFLDLRLIRVRAVRSFSVPRPLRALPALVVFLALFARARRARADGPLDGAWTMTAVNESFMVQEWSAPCGPAPVSGTMLPGATVTVTGGGGELQISGGRRTLRTDQCLDPMPTLARSVHTQDAKSWRTRCGTPPGDPRHAVVNTAYFVSGSPPGVSGSPPGVSSDNTITIAETGRYEFTINDARCVADVRRGATMSRVVAPAATGTASGTTPDVAPAATPTAAAPPPATLTAPTPKVDCSVPPGDPVRLEVRPSRKLLKQGDTFPFHAVVLDSAGCPTPTAIQWSVGPLAFKDGQTHAGVPTIDGAGKLTLPAADFPDVAFDVIGTAAGRSARASVQVTSPANYEALVEQSGLGPTGERDEPAVVALATSSLGTESARAEDGARKRRLAFIGVVGGLTGLLLVVAIVGVARSRKAKSAESAAEARHAEKMRDFERQKAEREAQHAAQMKAHRESVAIAQQQAAAAAARGVDTGPMFCPSCRREFPPGTAHCPFDANRLVGIRGHEGLMAGPSGGICPTCHRGFNPGVKVCPHDGDELVPAPAATSAPPPPQTRGKICPACGGRFDGSSAFCVKDGTQLVLLN